MVSTAKSHDIKAVFAANLERLINENNKSRKEVCKDIGIKYTTFCDWINGRTLPGTDRIEKLSSYFGLQVGDLFTEHNLESSSRDRLGAYYDKIKELDMKTMESITDEQIKELLKSGFRFRHKTLEQYIEESGKPFIISEEFDWGEPVGDEIW
ncbi:MAG TPA: hypothetical protein DCG85_03475 [Lachnospiraceae bacterium]|nr:hypothetical protein [Lachnospiraceae bacterium]